MPLRRSQQGQAAVELVAVVPLILLVGAIVWQLALAGHAAWLSANAARAAARAAVVGKSARDAARSALPRSLERGLVVKRLSSGAVHVQVRTALGIPISSTSSLGEPK